MGRDIGTERPDRSVEIGPDRSAWTRERTGRPGHNVKDRTGGTGELGTKEGQDSQETAAGTGRPEKTVGIER